MIFIDTNVFLRFFDGPDTPETINWYKAAESLFRRAARGQEDLTTSEVVLHEVAHVLGSNKHYNLEATQVASYLNAIVQMPGLKFPRGDKQLYLRALDIFSAHPKLEFSNSIIAARAERIGASLATFDERLAKLDFVNRWEPPRLPNN